MAFELSADSLGFDSSQNPLTEALKEYFIWPLLAVVYLGMSALFPQVWGVRIVNQVIISSVDLVVLAIGITFVMAAAEIDLSIVGTMGVAPFVATWLIKSLGVPFIVAVGIGLPLVAAAIGLTNAYLVNKLEIDSLIATLGTYFLLIGVLFVFTQGATISGFGEAYTFIGNESYAGISLILVAILVIAVGAHLVLTRLPFGQDLLLTGGNEDSASRAGVNTEKVRRNAFIICAVLSALAGFLLSSRLAIISSTFGQGRLLPAIAAPILGGIRLTGGQASIHQAVGGALLLQMIDTCLTIAGVSGYNVRLFTGVLVLSAIILGGLRTYRTE
ncbi:MULTISPECIES: ABC transporter permease [Haloarcula]|uniref:ABC transporter permease n=1 Tax=Haloarcula TaxID=2237 RepID=UPI0023EBB115|nr:ABC transporter permease [Halomicroarcula sp. XH51]